MNISIPVLVVKSKLVICKIQLVVHKNARPVIMNMNCINILTARRTDHDVGKTHCTHAACFGNNMYG